MKLQGFFCKATLIGYQNSRMSLAILVVNLDGVGERKGKF